MRVRRTVSLPKSIDELLTERAREDGSYSAALVRLVEAGERAIRAGRAPDWIGAGEGPRDLGRNVEKYLRHALRKRR